MGPFVGTDVIGIELAVLEHGAHVRLGGRRGRKSGFCPAPGYGFVQLGHQLGGIRMRIEKDAALLAAVLVEDIG